MNIRMTQTRRGTIFEALCDLCGKPIELSETCHYLTRRLSGSRRGKKGPHSVEADAINADRARRPDMDESLVCHAECDRTRHLPGYWSQMHRVRWLLEELLDNHRQRYPVLTEFLATLPNSQKQE